MSESQSRRSAPFEAARAPFERPVSLKFERTGANISMGGMFVRTKQFQEPGSVFEFAFNLSGDCTLIQGSGEVVWVREDDLGQQAPSGLGIRFLELDRQSRKSIFRLLDQHLRDGGVPFDVDNGREVPRAEKFDAGEQGLPETLDIESGTGSESEVAPEGSTSALASTLEPATGTGFAMRESEARLVLQTANEQPVGYEGVTAGEADEQREGTLEELVAKPSLPDVHSFEAAARYFEPSPAEPVEREFVRDDVDLAVEVEEAAKAAAVKPVAPPAVGAPRLESEPTLPGSDLRTRGMVAASTLTKRSTIRKLAILPLLLVGALLFFLIRNSLLPEGRGAGGDSRLESPEIDLASLPKTTAIAGGVVTKEEDGDGTAADQLSVPDGEAKGGGVARLRELAAPPDLTGAEPTELSAAVEPLDETEVSDESGLGVAASGSAAGDVEVSLRLARWAVRDWAAAWANQDTTTYPGFYSRIFQPPGGVSGEAWEAQRRERLTAPKWITVELSEMDVSPGENDRINASFVQAYRSDRYSDVVKKRLELRLEEGQWKIVKEWSTR